MDLGRWDGRGKCTAWMRAQDVADGFGVRTDTVDSRDEISTVAFQEDAVFGPVVVFVVLCPGLF
jgi:hypothetical protein